jgi:membrane protease YdiL (CAAX protease family)
VKFFQGAGRERERLAVVISAVVIAPLSEELFFRGIIYGVAKKYGGVAAALIFNATLFAFIHGSLPAFGGLFILAACLTLAYEFSGSLYVPIVMHACFNASQLAQMFFDPVSPKP